MRVSPFTLITPLALALASSARAEVVPSVLPTPLTTAPGGGDGDGDGTGGWGSRCSPALPSRSASLAAAMARCWTRPIQSRPGSAPAPSSARARGCRAPCAGFRDIGPLFGKGQVGRGFLVLTSRHAAGTSRCDLFYGLAEAPVNAD
jgi:hypothetical protein